MTRLSPSFSIEPWTRFSQGLKENRIKKNGANRNNVASHTLTTITRLRSLVDRGEGEILDINLHLCVVKLATNETIGIKHAYNRNELERSEKKKEQRTCWLDSGSTLVF
jgi:hypothetical protein